MLFLNVLCFNTRQVKTPILTHSINPQTSFHAPTACPRLLHLNFLLRYKKVFVSLIILTLYAFTIIYDCLSPSYFSFVSSLDFVSISKTTCEAMVDPSWSQEMVEMATLHSNGTWELGPLPPGKQIVGCCWVYIVTAGPHGQNNFCSSLFGYRCYSSLAFIS